MTAEPVCPIPPTADPLTDALKLLRMEGIFYCRSELTKPFGAGLPPLPGSLWFHVVTKGTCMLVDRAGEQHLLHEGELAVLPHGGGHRLVDADPAERGCPSVLDMAHDYVTPQYAILRAGGGGDPVELICGAVRLGNPAARHLTEVLPEVIHVDAASTGRTLEWLPLLLEMMAGETSDPGPGSEAVVTRVCDILVIAAIRHWLDTDPAAHTGWIGALRDPQLGPAVVAIHRSPDRAWTVAELAATAAMSRSAFSARFTDLVGEGPMQYVTRWRMHVATDLLRTEQLTVATIAERLGYGSEAAFGRAYKRTVGTPPGTIRRAAEPPGRETFAPR